MIKTALAVLVLGLLLSTTGLVAGEKGDASSTTLTLKGEILDMACYLAHAGRGPQHRKCALRCAEEGQPIGLITSEGELYLLMADHSDTSGFEKAKKLAGQEVEIKGEPAQRSGIAGLTVLEVKKL